MRSIKFLIPYFGKWPEWFPIYLETCAWNPDIEWLFFTDCTLPVDPPQNVKFVETTLDELSARFAKKLNLPSLRIERPYKLCDFKPAFGFLFQEHLNGFDNWAHGDVDVVYGDLRSTLTDTVLQHDIVSMLRRHISGHLAVFRNTDSVNNLFRSVPQWEEIFADSKSRKMDETLFTRALKLPEFQVPVVEREWDGPPIGAERNFCFFESWNTPRFFLNRKFSLRRIRWRGLAKNKLWRGQARIPDVWYWKSGRLTNNVDEIDLPYLHFMHWNREEWRCLDKIVHGAPTDYEDGFRVESLGFFPAGARQPTFHRCLQQEICRLLKRLAFRIRRLLKNS